MNNLIINAYRHNSSGTAVLIMVHVVAGTVFVTIADNGKEIDKKLLEKMFDPFVCGNASRTRGSGSGLGLAIAARIVERHDAKLYVENDISGYTKGFVIQLGRSCRIRIQRCGRNGYEAVSVSEIAGELGMTKGGII